jgi:uncharacterized protein
MKTKKRQSTSIRELRFTTGDVELRVQKNGDQRTIFGYAALFAPAQTQDMGGWREEVHPNAFDRCLRSSPDVVALFNHNSDAIPLARTTSGTLRLSTDNRGLRYEFTAPNTTLARDLTVSMERGDIHQSSYGFICRSDSWRNDKDGTPIRTVLDADLIDVSPVVNPATLDTTSGVRAALRSAPAAIRAKFLRDIGDGEVNPASDPDDDTDDDEDCECDCDACQMDDRCKQCDRESCDDERCAEAGCPAAGKTRTLRLRLKLAQHRAKTI